MESIEQLGWDQATIGELDHRLLKAPHIKLRSITMGDRGDAVYCIDLRITTPNRDFLSITELHSLEHFLLAGFRKYLPEKFISIGIMGCQTGFYLTLLNEGVAEKIAIAYRKVLEDILSATEVPYANIQDCGNYQNHSLELVQDIARNVLAAESRWLQVL